MTYEELGIKDKMSIIWGDEGVEVISDKIFDTGRWTSHHTIIFKLNDKFYRTHYSRGLTEQQAESPWEYDDPEINEVVPTEKTITVYEDK